MRKTSVKRVPWCLIYLTNVTTVGNVPDQSAPTVRSNGVSQRLTAKHTRYASIVISNWLTVISLDYLEKWSPSERIWSNKSRHWSNRVMWRRNNLIETRSNGKWSSLESQKGWTRSCSLTGRNFPTSSRKRTRSTKTSRSEPTIWTSKSTSQPS